jgi:hypothetical protein
MRCMVPSYSAMQEMVLKQKIAPGLKVIMALKVTAMELAFINVARPTWHARCRCLRSDRALRGYHEVLLDRTTSLIATRRIV